VVLPSVIQETKNNISKLLLKQENLYKYNQGIKKNKKI
jgi:hypothetical protein